MAKEEAGLRRLTPASSYTGTGLRRLTPASFWPKEGAGLRRLTPAPPNLWAPGKEPAEAGGSRLLSWPKSRLLARKEPAFGQEREPAQAGSFCWAPRKEPAKAGQSRLLLGQKRNRLFGLEKSRLLARKEAGFGRGRSRLLPWRPKVGEYVTAGIGLWPISSFLHDVISGRLEAASGGSAENTPTAPKGKSRILKTPLLPAFPGRKSDGNGGFPTGRSENGKTGSTVGMFFTLSRETARDETVSFLAEKRRFLTAFGGNTLRFVWWREPDPAGSGSGRVLRHLLSGLWRKVPYFTLYFGQSRPEPTAESDQNRPEFDCFPDYWPGKRAFPSLSCRLCRFRRPHSLISGRNVMYLLVIYDEKGLFRIPH